MATNHLEQLIAEWYEYKGYFIRRNIHVGKRSQGGYECELDIVAFNPQTKDLVHIEPSNDSNSWKKRELCYKKKFDAGKKYIPDLFKGITLPNKIRQIAVFVNASKKNRQAIAGGEIMLIEELLSEITNELTGNSLLRRAVPEQYPLLRTIQFITHYKDKISFFQKS